MIKLHLTGNSPIWINPIHIEHLRLTEADFGGLEKGSKVERRRATEVHLSSGDYFIVSQSPEEIITFIGDR